MFKKRSTMDMVRPDKQEKSNKPPIAYTLDDEVELTNSKENNHEERRSDKEKKARVKKPKPERQAKYSFKDCFRNKSFLGGICIVAGLLIAFIVVPMMQKVATTETSTVVVLTQDVTIGDTIKKDMVATKSLLTGTLPDNAITKVDDAIGKYVIVPACKGDILTGSRLSASYPGTNPELAALPSGKLAISLSLDTLAQSVSGKLREGDVIQLYAVFGDEKMNALDYHATAIPELRYVEVLSVTDEDATDISGQAQNTSATDISAKTQEVRKISTVTLVVNDAQAQAIAGLETTAKLHAALAVRGDADKKAALLKLQDAYFTVPDTSSVTEVTP